MDDKLRSNHRRLVFKRVWFRTIFGAAGLAVGIAVSASSAWANRLVFGDVTSFDGLGAQVGVSVAVDGAGNIYSVGRFLYRIDLDPGPAF